MVAVCVATHVSGLYSWILAPLSFAVVLIQSIAHHQSPLYAWLNRKALYALGVLSYSLYLYHQFANRLPGSLKTPILEIAFSIALAVGSYFIVEKPFLVLKEKVSRSASRADRIHALS